MYVTMGNLFYFLFILLGLMSTVGLLFLLNKKGDQTRHKVFLVLLFTAFSLHFLKLFFEPYASTFPISIRKSTFENVCAVSTLIFPFIYLSKNKILKDYMLIFGIIGGLAAFIYPTEALPAIIEDVTVNKYVFSFDVLRFYYAHFVIFSVPFMMGYYRVHEVPYRRIFLVPMTFIFILCVIFINEFILLKLGFVEPEIFFDVNIRNSSLIFGIPDNFKGIGILLDIFVFNFLKIHPITHEPFYWPVMWIIVPVFIYVIILGFIITFSFRILKHYQIQSNER